MAARFEQARVFAEVAEQASFTRAAERLGCSKAHASVTVSALEAALGVQLLHRTTRRIDLTAAGRAYLDYCRQLRDTLIEAEHAVSAVGGEVAGTLRLTMPSSFGEVFLADIAREFLREYPGVRLEADVPIAFQLSGGLDSSAVLAAARHATTAPLSAFCVAFRDASEEGAHYNEIEAAAEIAEHCGARLHTVEVDDAQIAEHFAPAVIAAEGPAINAHAAAKLLLSRSMRAHGYVVALTGEGADEVLWGYPHLVVDAGQRPRGAHAASRGLMLPSEDTASEGTPTWLRAKIALGALLAPLLRAPILCDPRAVIASEIEPSLLRCRSPEQIGALTWSSYALEGYILRTLGDPLELAHGIEGRVPFLDHHLFDLARSLPTELLIREGVSKWLLREAARLPQVHRAREKHPFVAPPLGPRSLCRIRELVEDPSFLDQPMFAPQRVRDLLAKYIHFDATARKRYDPALWMIASLAILQQHYGLRT